MHTGDNILNTRMARAAATLVVSAHRSNSPTSWRGPVCQMTSPLMSPVRWSGTSCQLRCVWCTIMY